MELPHANSFFEILNLILLFENAKNSKRLEFQKLFKGNGERHAAVAYMQL